VHCKKCGSAMRESPRSHHKKRKWICPKCGRARMQRTDKVKDKAKRKESRDDY